MKDNIQIKDLFDYQDFSHSIFLDQHKYPWEVVRALDGYISSLIKDLPDQKIIGEGTIIDPSVKIDGPLITGKNCIIEDNVLIRGGCILGDGVHIGHGVELKHSIILDNENNTKVSHLIYIGDSIIGRNINIGGGAIVANWRFDKKNIVISANEKIDTGMEKFGAAVGDNSSIGANAVLNPGTILGKGSVVYPLVSAFGVHPEKSTVK